VTLGDERRSGQAIFKDVEREVPCLVEGRATSCRDSFAHEIAAFRIDRMMGLDMVPPTVVRVIDGKMGSLQLWVEGAINENNRRDEDLSPPDPEDFASQLERAELFDRLISNPDRNGSGILITTDDWGVHLIDHSTAFAPSVSLAQADEAWETRSNGKFTQDLVALDLTVLRNRLRPLLNDAELEALLARVESAINAYSEAGGR